MCQPKPFHTNKFPSHAVEATYPGFPHKLQSAPNTNSECCVKLKMEPLVASVELVLYVSFAPSLLRSLHIQQVISYEADIKILE